MKLSQRQLFTRLPKRHQIVRSLIVPMLSGIFALSGCSTAAPRPKSSEAGSTIATSSGITGVYAPARSLLPPSVKASGVLVVGTSATYPPYAFYKPGSTTLVGYVPSLAAILAKELGLKLEWHVVLFSEIIPGIESGRYDIGWDGITDTPVREQTVLEVDNYTEHNGFLVLSANKSKYNSYMSLCGHTVSDVAGGIQPAVATYYSKVCISSGRPPITNIEFPDNGPALAALLSGRVAANLQTYTSCIYEAQELHGQITPIIIKSGFESTFYNGIAVAKSNAALARAIQVGLQHMVADGSYNKALSAWGLKFAEVKEIVIDRAR